MAKVYAPPEELGDPPNFADFKDANGRYDFQIHMEAEQDWTEKLQDWCREHGNGDIKGEVVRFGVADGYAQYVVYRTKPCEMIHVPTGDNWHIPEAHARGLRASDLREQVEGQRKLAALFSKEKS